MNIDLRARQAVLDALLSGTPLPGGVQPLLFPDTPHITDAAVALIEDHGPALRVPPRVRVVPRKALRELLGDQSIPVLEFLEPEPFPDRVGVRLRVSRVEGQSGLVPLGEVIATFTSSPTSDLTVTDPTHVLAY